MRSTLKERLGEAPALPALETAASDHGSVDLHPATAAPAKVPLHKRRMAWLLAAALAVGVGTGVPYYLHARAYEDTDDAFVEGHVIPISPRIAGHVARLNVDDNQQVHRGDVLVELDPADYQARLDQAQAALNAAKAKEDAARAADAMEQVTADAEVEQALAAVKEAESALTTAHAAVGAAESRVTQAAAAIQAAEANVEQARAAVAAAQAEKDRADEEFERVKPLVPIGAATKHELTTDQATARAAAAEVEAAAKKVNALTSAVAEAQANLASAQQALKQAQSQVGANEALLAQARAKFTAANVAPQRLQASKAALDTATADVHRAQAAVDAAKLDLSYTRIVAPEDGRITNRSVEQGQWLQTGQAMFALVPNDLWVTANFKETQLDEIRPGQKVEIKVDAYPGLKLKGHVDSIQRGAGARFSLLPPENATGNYVKVVQRVPVKIVFDQPIDREHAIGPGMSVVPEVRVK